MVQTLSKCSKVDVCKCSTDEGTIDLWSLAGTASNTPRYDYDPFLLDIKFSVHDRVMRLARSLQREKKVQELLDFF